MAYLPGMEQIELSFEVPENVIFRGVSCNRDASVQWSDVYVDGKFAFGHKLIMPKFYGIGGILHCALTGGTPADPRDEFCMNESFDSLEEANAVAAQFPSAEVRENWYDPGFHLIIADFDEALRYHSERELFAQAA
jgi:hypothetical protein